MSQHIPQLQQIINQLTIKKQNSKITTEMPQTKN